VGLNPLTGGKVIAMRRVIRDSDNISTCLNQLSKVIESSEAKTNT
jgi:hypothetical protein